VAKKLRILCNGLFTVLFGFILIQLFLYTAETSIAAVILLFPFLFLVLRVLPRIIRQKHLSTHFGAFSYRLAWGLIQLPGIAVMLAAFFY